jgi:ABC-type methionine transport system ATPase subunit
MDVRVKLTFPEALVREPLISRLARDHDVEPNIRRAHVDGNEGWIICEIGGDPQKVEDAVSWLREQGVRVDLLGDVVES